MTITRNLRIRGRVQGVGFRMYVVRKARQLGLSGWVRNRLDGSVEAAVQGDPAAVEAMISWARRGPPSAAVSRVEVSEVSAQYKGFETRSTE